MNVNDIYPSKYMKAADLGGRTLILKIAKISLEDFPTELGEQDFKPVLYFEKTKSALCLNKINTFEVAGGYGDEMDEWIGKFIEIYPTKTLYKGATVPCIRVRIPPNNGTASSSDVQAWIENSLNDEIPF